MTKRQGTQLQIAGSILIVTVMLTDRFLFSLQNNFILFAACISAALLIAGIEIVKRIETKERKRGNIGPN